MFKHPTATSSPTEAQILTVDVSGTTADTISNTVTDLGSGPKLITLAYSVPAQYRRQSSCAWVMNSNTLRKIRQLVDADGRPLHMPNNGLLGGSDGMLLDWPVIVSEWAPDDGTDTNLPILFGDLSAIQVPIRKGAAVTIAPERYVDTDETGFFIHQRAGVAVNNCDALRFGKV